MTLCRSCDGIRVDSDILKLKIDEAEINVKDKNYPRAYAAYTMALAIAKTGGACSYCKKAIEDERQKYK